METQFHPDKAALSYGGVVAKPTKTFRISTDTSFLLHRLSDTLGISEAGVIAVALRLLEREQWLSEMRQAQAARSTRPTNVVGAGSPDNTLTFE